MRIPSLFGPATVGVTVTLQLWSLLTILESPTANALSFTSVSQPQIDLSPLGRVALTGSFDTVSIYSFTEQAENVTVGNNYQSLSTPLPNGVLANLSTADGHIRAICPFTRKDGSYFGLVIGGDFTSLGAVESPGIALFNTTSGAVTALPGLKGSVSALLCDQDTGRVYVGGDFQFKNISNAASWAPGSGWSSLPFQGLNGPVSSILKDADGHIVFGGSFDGIGTATSSLANSAVQVEQAINLQTATITSDANSDIAGFTDPHNVICSTSGQAGPGKTWLLHDYAPGFWRADMRFGFQPSKLRLYNTHLDGRGVKTFLMRALPINGIMNLTYTDPATGNKAFCDASCPLSNDPTVLFQDFTLVNTVGMNGFQIEISEWYGKGAGLNGIELMENGIFAYAVNDFNEPSCAGIDHPSRATTTGPWSVTPSGASQSDYLTAHVTNADTTSTSVTFEPDIKQPGNYTVLIYTPGCEQDGTCSSRGIVNVTGTFAMGSGSPHTVSKIIYQTNNFEKYDTLYSGFVDASSDSFRPSVTVTPLPNQGNALTVVASRVQFEQLTSSGGLNGLFDYDPASQKPPANFSQSVVDRAGVQLDPGASIQRLAQHNGAIFVAGNFSHPGVKNIMFFSDSRNVTALSQGGLNAPVDSLLVHDDVLYVGGSFTDTANGGNAQLQRVAAYSLSSNAWSPLGGGVNGRVTSILALPLNVSSGINETTIAISGDFDQTLAFAGNPSVTASGIAIWVPSRQNWLQNLNVSQSQFTGQLSAATSANGTVMLAGSLDSPGIAASDAALLYETSQLSLGSLPLKARHSGTTAEIFTGVFDTTSSRNLTILGGHFTATASNGSTIHNLAVLNNTDGTVTGLTTTVDSNSTFLALAVSGNTLFAGGNVTGTVGQSHLNGFTLYDLPSRQVVQSQPAPLTGANVSVTSIVARPSSSEVYFGGTFDAAGLLPCPSVCLWDTSIGQWSRPGVNLGGSVLAMHWVSANQLFVVGDLDVAGNQTVVATYDAKAQAWSSFTGASFDGTVTAFSPASQDLSTFWLAGRSSNGSSFVVNYDGSKFQSVGTLFGDGTRILGLDVLATTNQNGGSAFLNKDQVLLVTGQLVIPGFGDASAAVFNGSTLTPFILSTSNGKPGSISGIFTEKANTYSSQHYNHSNGIAVLVSFCIALGCVFLIVVCGVILNKIQRRRQGYVAAPQSYGTDRPSPMRRVPPEYLFNTLGKSNPAAPTI